ncbi:replication restart helicase PriA [Candidatus Cardinium hertigii]|uniref:Replication restart protein PriA n=1 Tax=Candidatus Cardinium hertigii TaxID=247481 RepID=A0A3N2QBQ5_9BACT|nr:primosomal protein N' [Candidatus Cardinium hertigii]ROT47247.1 primosomal protein N' [Candidatus Cardinium hertigii]ROT47576.1 primosomal protein N' [Candidatus Cardinium hertigii]ROT47587.1 primosomal protein N' [Candidatus Cardinium hertigii]
MKKFADVLLPLPLKTLTYCVPYLYQNRIDVGSGVLVPLRTGKLFLAIVIKLHSEVPAYPTKDLLAVIYQEPLYPPQQLTFLTWIANYYLSHLGEALSVGLPKALDSPNNIVFQISPSSDTNAETETEQFILTSLQARPLSYRSIMHVVGQKEANKILMELLKKGLVKAMPAINIHQIDHSITYLTLSPTIHPDQIAKLCSRSLKQQTLVSYFVPTEVTATAKVYASKKELIALGYSKLALYSLLKKGILIEYTPLSFFTTPRHPLAILTAVQQKALIEIQTQFTEKAVVLLHGAIGSGKTELYMHLIHMALLEQKQVLLLIPEISLLTHMVERIKPFWKEWLVVYHSKQSPTDRLKTWTSVLNQPTLVVVGTRSALFLPFKQLQLIIIDEEHDNAYKQTDVRPAYHARDSSILLAKQYQAKVLLGSGTPSIESYYNAQSGKYGLVTLMKRFGENSSPKLFFIDLKIEKKRKAMRENFSFTLLSALQKNIKEGGQAMIFQNRRGYARYLLCESCGWVPCCRSCAVRLTYHQKANHLLCHYCGYVALPFRACNSCGSTQLHNIGFGTEKLEETLKFIFPEQKIGRMDFDSTQKKDAYRSILNEVNFGSIDILVGTQMIAKGLDFANIHLVGVLDIDGLLYFPDFRSNEKCFQLITQLAGRAGRRNHQGSVFIQTAQPHYPLFQHISNNDYQAMYKSELEERRKFSYPPYVKLIKLTLSCITETTLKSGAIELKKTLEKNFKGMVIGPQEPLIGKIRHYFLLDIFLKIPSSNLHTLQIRKEQLRAVCKEVLGKSLYKKIQILFDVDPI